MTTTIRTATTIITTMPDPTAPLSLMQWLSPAFPTGAFAYSHGLEQAVAAGEIVDAVGFAIWLGNVLEHGAGWSDAVLLACGLRGGDLEELDALGRAMAGSAERLRETAEQGAAFTLAQAGLRGVELPPRILPVALAEAARDLDLPAAQVISLFQHSFASNLVSAAIRLVPLGQIAGQTVLSELHGKIAEIAARAAQAELTDLSFSAFRAEVSAMKHETLDVRLFKT